MMSSIHRASRLWFMIIFVLPGLTGTAAAASGATMQMRADKAAAEVNAKYGGKGPGAAWLIAWKGKVLTSGGTGLADIEWGLPNTDETAFRLGSISKSVTAVTVLQLAEQDKLDLDRPIAEYASELPVQMGAVTMRQLLSHRSGLAEHAFDKELIPFIWQPMTTGQTIDLQKHKPISFAPGEEFQYVNFNYVLVAHVIEQITGETFVDFINDWFVSHGMQNSHYDENGTIIPNRAEFYDRRDGAVVNAADIDMSHVSAAGALLSSARDMWHWAQLLMTDKLIGAGSLAEAWTPAPLPDGTPTKYGLGFNVRELSGERVIWHSGLTPGGQGALGIAPESGVFVIILSNGFHMPNTSRTMKNMMSIMLTGKPGSE